MAPATRGEVYVMVNGQQAGFGGSWSRKGFNVDVSDIISEFNLTFSVEDSSEQDKYRGPFKNNKDYEWKFSALVNLIKLLYNYDYANTKILQICGTHP
ncbi:hypothetical protein RhiirA1_464825 [Rhizophagus irregularis]|uniref:Uncharacterized protein n=1 Tax=Rhizophagus irregularis TaxID=588596 RepID=A0A2N0RHB4_9GLOM|nr:hypothetical protein RhiirA1_464825 [Rhizophagus irregularis]